MANPLVSRVPKTVAEYRDTGVRYIATDTIAECWYAEPGAAENFSSFGRFYGERRRLEPLKVFDPRRWGGKGPLVYVYDVGTPGDPAPEAVAARSAPDCTPAAAWYDGPAPRRRLTGRRGPGGAPS